MNRHQKAVAVMAAINLLLLLLFPPFLDNPIQRGAFRSFESFYFLLMAPPGRIIHQELLTIEMFFVFANALAAWLALNAKDGAEIQLTERAALRGLGAFAFANVALIFLFPPFQPYPSMVRVPPEGFDGFFFAFGDKRNRAFFVPFLYLELILVMINLLVSWLVFGLLRGTVSAADQHLIEELHHIPVEKAEAIVHTIEEVAHPQPAQPHVLGRKEERRKGQDPRYRGPERRSGHDRRHEKPKA
jgi:hypothetical protein